jgi:V8-like Glu-specific endopeptidase
MRHRLVPVWVRRLVAVLTKSSALQRSRRPAVEILESRDVPALIPVSPSAGYPYTAIVKMVITFPDNQVYAGTGAMVDSFHVLTAGHNTYSSADGGWASSIKVTPMMDGDSEPFGSAWMTSERTYTSFQDYDQAHPHSTNTNVNDVGLLTLDRTIGNQTGWMGFGYDNNNGRFASGRVFNLAGYPATNGYDGTHMYLSSGPIAGLSPDGQAILYRQTALTTFGGMSGAPIWEYNPETGTRVIYGVHVSGTALGESLNFGVRITQSIFNDLQSWRLSDKTPGLAAVAAVTAVLKTAPLAPPVTDTPPPTTLPVTAVTLNPPASPQPDPPPPDASLTVVLTGDTAPNPDTQNPPQSPTVDTSAAPTVVTTPAPTTDTTPVPTADASAAPTAGASPTPTADTTPAPTAGTTPAPTTDTTPVPTADASAAPTVDTSAAPTVDASQTTTVDASVAPTETDSSSSLETTVAYVDGSAQDPGSPSSDLPPASSSAGAGSPVPDKVSSGGTTAPTTNSQPTPTPAPKILSKPRHVAPRARRVPKKVVHQPVHPVPRVKPRLGKGH